VAVLAALAPEGLTVDPTTQRHLEALRTRADPDVARFVDWAAGELADTLTRDLIGFGLPPMEARKEAMQATAILCRRVLGSARTWHRYHR
jgi:hypothetical protein